jgi:hypothetical protein
MLWLYVGLRVGDVLFSCSFLLEACSYVESVMAAVGRNMQHIQMHGVYVPELC